MRPAGRSSPARRRVRIVLVVAFVLAGAAGTGAAVLLTGTGSDDSAAPSTTTTTLAPTTTTAPPPTTETPTTEATTTTVPPPPVDDGTLELGDEGPAVGALQAHLDELGYWHGASDGTYGQLTRQAVMAFQKAEGLHRDGIAGPITRYALGGAARPAPHEPAGAHLEVDLARQVLIVVVDGQTRWVLNTSTGNGEAYAAPSGGIAVATTPVGRFQVYREIDGLREAPLGTLYRPKYFTGGIAVHGSGSIPAQPASHGCVRLTNAAMDLLWASGVAPLGTTVIVH